MKPKITPSKASDKYWKAYEQWKKLDIKLDVKLDVSKRFTREEAHERRPVTKTD